MSAAAKNSSPPSAPPLGERLPLRGLRFDLDALRRYAAASGDDNPIHIDADLARRVGLEAPPVHGMLLMGALEPAISAWRPDLRLQKLAAKFLRPLLAGESVEMSGRVVEIGAGEKPHVLLRLLAHNERREIVVIAEATLV